MSLEILSKLIFLSRYKALFSADERVTFYKQSV